MFQNDCEFPAVKFPVFWKGTEKGVKTGSYSRNTPKPQQFLGYLEGLREGENGFPGRKGEFQMQI